jgi:hypothetical protein
MSSVRVTQLSCLHCALQTVAAAVAVAAAVLTVVARAEAYVTLVTAATAAAGADAAMRAHNSYVATYSAVVLVGQ